MEYNSTRPHLIMREYGRNIQKMCTHALSIDNKEKRTLAAKSIIQIMGQMQPATREVNDYKHKLWDHLHYMTNLQLDVDAPYEKPIPLAEIKAPRLSYSNKDTIKYKPYGRIVQNMMQKAIEMPDGDEKEAFVMVIANQLKKSFLNWNRESVNDEMIAEHMIELSKGKLKIADTSKLINTVDLLRSQKKGKVNNKNNNNGSGSNQNKPDTNNGQKFSNNSNKPGFNFKNKYKKPQP